MPFIRRAMPRILPLVAVLFAATCASAQSGNAGAVRGTVTDPSGAVIPNATVHLTNEISGFDRTATSDAAGQFAIPNVAFAPYVIKVSATGFAALSQNVSLNSVVGISLKLVLQIAGGTQTVTVESTGALIEDDPTFHVDVDRDLFNKVPLESA
ncbi:MAG: carboxypeptidase-like regulatory domain-containing protein, partial [Terracidiphilus sp.]